MSCVHASASLHLFTFITYWMDIINCTRNNINALSHQLFALFGLLLIFFIERSPVPVDASVQQCTKKRVVATQETK